MSINSQKSTHTPPALEFKSSTFFVPVLILHTDDLHVIEQFLQEKIRLAPEFFKNSPLVFDLQVLNKSSCKMDISALIHLFRNVGMFPIGIRGGNEQQNDQAQRLFVPIDSIRTKDSSSAIADIQETEEIALEPEQVEPEVDDVPLQKESMLITDPVRSGQRIYAYGDLVIMSQVSAGAEIMAEGNIHVYNTLRGRALAGVQGNKKARIFCSDLQAELVSIAGDYKIHENLDKNVHKKAVQIYLQEHALIVEIIS